MVDCVVEPAQKVKVGSATLGILKDVAFNRGDAVKAGEVIAQLDSSVEDANVALARAQAGSLATIAAQRTRLELYKRRFDRQSQLSKGIVTQEKLDQVEADYEIGQRDLQTELLKHDLAALELQRAEAQLALRVIRSPINGLVTERLMAGGEFVRQDSAIYTLVQLDPLYVEAYVTVADWSLVQVGSPASSPSTSLSAAPTRPELRLSTTSLTPPAAPSACGLSSGIRAMNSRLVNAVRWRSCRPRQASPSPTPCRGSSMIELAVVE